MPAPAKPPRLFLRDRSRSGRASAWVILDRGREISTGAREAERDRAEKALERYLGDKHRPTLTGADPAQALIAEVLDAYQLEHAPKTKRPDKIGIAVGKLLDFFGLARVATITPARCAAYVAWRCAQTDARATRSAGRPISLQTARADLVTLNAAIQWCWENQRLTRPVAVKLPAMGASRERHLTRIEAAALLAAALGFYRTGRSSVRTRRTIWRWRRDPARINRHLARFILIGLYTGTRHSAIRSLQWMSNVSGGWFDLDAGILYRRPQRAVDTRKRRPPLPVPSRLLPHVRRWARLGGRHAIEWRGEPIGPLRTSWEGARELAYLGPDVTPHILRHTFATWLLQGGRSTFEVAGALGCSEEVVRETYGHHERSGLARTVDLFAARPWPVAGPRLAHGTGAQGAISGRQRPKKSK